MTLPRKWATTEDYTTGVDTGTPTRVDPGAGLAAEGVVPHEGVAAQHFNHLLGTIIDALYAYQETPEEYLEIRDDFTGCVFDATTDILHSAYPWQVTSTENAVPSTDATNGHPGTVTASLLATEEFEIELAGQQNSIRWGDLEDATFVVRFTSSDVTAAEFFVGLAENHTVAGVGNNAVGIWLEHGTNATQWLIRHKVGGVDDATIAAGAFLGSTVWVPVKLHRISATQVEVSVFGDLKATLTDGVDAPADGTLMTLGWYAKAGSAAAMTPEVDLLYVRCTTPNR